MEHRVGSKTAMKADVGSAMALCRLTRRGSAFAFTPKKMPSRKQAENESESAPYCTAIRGYNAGLNINADSLSQLPMREVHDQDYSKRSKRSCVQSGIQSVKRSQGTVPRKLLIIFVETSTRPHFLKKQVSYSGSTHRPLNFEKCRSRLYSFS
jgi:hypothetical protein